MSAQSTAPLALVEPPAEARAAVNDLLFDDVHDFALTIALQAIRVAAAAERRDLTAAQERFALLRLSAIALFDDLKRLAGEPR